MAVDVSLNRLGSDNSKLRHTRSYSNIYDSENEKLIAKLILEKIPVLESDANT